MRTLILMLMFLPLTASAAYWCGANNKIYTCDMSNGVLTYPEEEISLDRMFPDVPQMKAIAECESGMSQEARGKLGEIGILQIMPFHIPEAKSIGLDVFTLNGNISYARYLYDKNGLKDWSCAKILRFI